MTDREIPELLVKKLDNVENNLDNLTSDVNNIKIERGCCIKIAP